MPQKPSTLEFGVDETPPVLHVALLGLQYALLNSVYLILVVIIVRADTSDPATPPPFVDS